GVGPILQPLEPRPEGARAPGVRPVSPPAPAGRPSEQVADPGDEHRTLHHKRGPDDTRGRERGLPPPYLSGTARAADNESAIPPIFSSRAPRHERAAQRGTSPKRRRGDTASFRRRFGLVSASPLCRLGAVRRVRKAQPLDRRPALALERALARW